ncbi:hypothetical protein [Bradyrhizobium sp. NAS80.1]|uniref:hypothetical protein n=1 Tax=Bradyrhizobium sp. NAS80.1 TaxID=1680159 RepID=UPI00143DDD84|nr:hypothetical protein [Bradyrhizobium sp. NAS80.1]
MQNAADKSPDSKYNRVRTRWKPDIPLPVVWRRTMTIAQNPANVIASVASVYGYADPGNSIVFTPV